MKKIFLLVIIILIFGCNPEKKQNKIDLADLNLIIQTDKKVDSVWVSNIGQTESFFLPFKDTIKINFKEKLNDLYNISFYTKDGRISNQLWLNGNSIILRGKLNKKIEIDSVLNSDLYYSSINFSKKYRELIQNKADSTTIDDFLLKNIKNNISSPLSFAIGNPFIYRNQNNKNKIRKLFDLLESQNDTLKNHFISIHGKIENILKVSSLNLSDFKFGNIQNKISSIKLEKTKYYLLDFWFINCPPCVKDHKLISEKLDFLEENNIQLIGISTDRNYSDWKNYLTEHEYLWKNFREIDTLKRVTKEMAIWSFPTYLLIDDIGEIKARFNSFDDFEKYVK